MNFTVKTLAYLKKGLPLLAAVCLIPSVVMAVLIKPFNIVSFFPLYSSAEVNGFSDVVWLVFDKYALTHVYPYLIVYAVCALGLSFSLSIVENHFRVGRLTVGVSFKNINNCLVPVLIAFGVIFLVYLFCNFLFACAVTLVHLLISGAGAVNAADYAVTAVVAVVLFMLMLQILKSVFLWAPMMIVYGYNFLDAVIESSSAVSKAARPVYLRLLFPFFVWVVLEAGLGLFSPPLWSLYLVNILLYVLIFAYYSAYIMVSAFELTGMERRDLKRMY